ncbi:MAG: tetratricopeptide repeat protein [Candidatus Omnitrophota bacterium]
MKKILVVLLCVGLIGCTTCKDVKKKVCVEKKKAPACGQKVSASLKAADQKEIDDAIIVFSQEIKSKPGHFGAYYNRAVAYFHNKQYDKAWEDIHKAQALGGVIDSDFLGRLKKASGREK